MREPDTNGSSTAKRRAPCSRSNRTSNRRATRTSSEGPFQSQAEGDGTISFRLERAGVPADDDLQVTYRFTVDKNLDVTFDGSEGAYLEGEEIPAPEIYAQ